LTPQDRLMKARETSLDYGFNNASVLVPDEGEDKDNRHASNRRRPMGGMRSFQGFVEVRPSYSRSIVLSLISRPLVLSSSRPLVLSCSRVLVLSCGQDKIEQARRDGSFNTLKGRGKPIPKEDGEEANSPLSRTEILMNRIVKRQGVAPPWVELQGELDVNLSNFRTELRSTWGESVV
jgi:hypothetical protein